MLATFLTLKPILTLVNSGSLQHFVKQAVRIRLELIGLKLMGPQGVGLLEDRIGGLQKVPNVTITNFRDAGGWNRSMC